MTTNEMSEIMSQEKVTSFGGTVSYQAPTKEQIKDAIVARIELAKALLETIKMATQNSMLKGVPSGQLYAQVMHVLDLDQYQQMIAMLKDAKVVTERNHLLSYVEVSNG